MTSRRPDPLRSVRHFLHRVAIPRWNVHDDRTIPFDDRLAAKTRVDLKPWGLLNTIFLVFFGFRAIGHPLGDVHMTGRTGTDATAGMLNVDAGMDRHLKQRLPLGGFQLLHRLIGIGQGVRIVEMKRHRNGFFGVREFAVAHVHARILVA